MRDSQEPVTGTERATFQPGVVPVVAVVVFAGWFVLVSVLRLFVNGPPAEHGAIPWQTDVAAAMAQAAREGRPVMVDVYTDWCTWCKRLDRDVYARRDVAEAAATFVPLKTNPERDPAGEALARRHNVRAFPTILFLDPQGREIHRIEGYAAPPAFLAEMEKAGLGSRQ